MNNYPEYPYMGYRNECNDQPIAFPAQFQQQQPGIESWMNPKPIYDNPYYKASGKLQGKTAIITGGDSGIGRAVALLFAKEGANVVINYVERECRDAQETKQAIEQYNGKCLLVEGDITLENTPLMIVDKTLRVFSSIDILVNNCGVQFVQPSLLDISYEQLLYTYEVNVFSFFRLTKECLPYMKAGSSIINNASITAFEGEKNLIDYSSSKGAIVSFSRSLALSLADQQIRVNTVSPGYFWTALQPASWRDAESIETFGTDAPMGRAGQPFEIAPAFLYLACDDSYYVTGEVMHINGGKYLG